MKHRLGTALKWPAAAIGFTTGAYAAYVGAAWLRYGHPYPPVTSIDRDTMLDRFMPEYEVAERHRIHVAAPAEITFQAACEADLMQSPTIRTIFKVRELILGGQPDTAEHPRGLLELTKSQGWNMLAEVPGREIVMGTVTQPWAANVIFQNLSPDQFIEFNEPEYVKIVWNLRADPTISQETDFRTETRVITTDRIAREKFRRYWSFFSPGIVLIRLLLLRQLRTESERRAHGNAVIQGKAL